MGGWISIVGSISDFDSRLEKFKKIFSVEGVPDFRLEVYGEKQEMKIICWAWKKGGFPDVYVKKTGTGNVLILCGVITDLGHFGSLPPDQDQTTMKILEFWSKHGERIIDQLNGSFSCLFYDKRGNKVSLFTDRFASRSVWMTREDGAWIIGNFPSAVVAVKKYTPKIDPVGLWSLLHTGRHIGAHGLYSDVCSLLSGQKAVLSPNSEVVINQWKERKYQPEKGLSPKEWGYRLAEALTLSANRYRNVSRSPYLFLSGGLDSRIVAAAFKKPLKTLTLCTEPNIESRIASLVSRVIGLENQTIIRSPYWYLENMPASALISSGNFLNHHTHFITPVQRFCDEDSGAEFMLGDLLENLNKHYFSKSSHNHLTYSPENIEDFLYRNVPYTMKDRNRSGIHFNRELKKSIENRYTVALKEFAKSLMRVSSDPADCFDTFLRWADISITPTYNMITCMWPLTRERNLYLDNELNELSLKIPAELRGAGVLHKWILYHLNKRLIVVPDANTFLLPLTQLKFNEIAKKIRPLFGNMRRSIIRARKGNEPVLKTSGSWLLIHEMYRRDKQYRGHIEELLSDKSIFQSDIFDLEQMKKTWEEYLAGNIKLHFEIEALISFGNLQRMIPCKSIEF
jgi:hypothetical protein